MKTKVIVYSGKLEIMELPAQSVRQGHLLVKTLYVYLGEVEKILFKGIEPINNPVVPGGSGVVRVLEDPSSKHSELSGKPYIVSPIGKSGLLGLDVNGLLATYQGIHPSYLYKHVSNPSPIHSIYPYLAYSITVGRKAFGTTLVIGCNLFELATAYYLQEHRGSDVTIICSNIPRHLKLGKFRFYKHVSDLARQYDTIVVGFDSYPLVHEVLKSINTENLLISMFSRLYTLPLKPGFNARVEYVDSVEVDEEQRVVEELSKRFMRNIKVVDVDSIEKVTGLLPPKGLGVIVKFR